MIYYLLTYKDTKAGKWEIVLNMADLLRSQIFDTDLLIAHITICYKIFFYILVRI